MEGGPKNPEENLPQEVKDTFSHIADIPMESKDKMLLRSLILEPTPGQLVIILNGEISRSIDIYPNESQVAVSEKISETLDNLYTQWTAMKKDHPEWKEAYVTVFTKASIQ